MQPTDPASGVVSPEDILGTYINPGAGASGLRLSVRDNGTVQLEVWQDLGGWWLTVRQGKFLIVGSLLLTSMRDFGWCYTSFARDGELQVRTVQLRRDPDEPTLERCTVLAPSDSIAELDQAILAGGPALAELVESMFALRLFFRQQPC